MDLSSCAQHMARVTWSGGVRSHGDHLYSSLSSLQSSSVLVDVSLVSDAGAEVMCHKIVLASASHLLRQLFQDNDKKHSVVVMPGVSHHVLNQIVQFIYTGSIQLPEQDMNLFLSAASLLQMEKIEVEQDNMMPHDLSMKPAKKKIKVESPGSSPSPAHENRPETFLQKTLLSYPAVQTGSEPTSSSATKPRHSSSSSGDKHSAPGSKLPNWSQSQLQDAIESVITQRLRFTQASARYGIPKGTLYDNILGKSKRMQVLDQVGLTESQEVSVLEFCCEISNMPYNRRTSRSLSDIIQFITKLKHREESEFSLTTRQGFKWWWAFTKKHK